jgi:TfoX/Sxy family transcriptional regulator of competence genes
MATDLSFVEYVADQTQLGDQLTYKKMFGEYALYLNGKVVALVCDNTLFVKPMASTDALTAKLARNPPYPGAKPHVVADSLLDDSGRLSELLCATEKGLPAPKVRKKRKK